MKEITTENYFVDKVRSLGAICYKGSVTHHPDQLILRPGKTPFYVEFKVPTNGLQNGQKAVFKDIRDKGYIIYLCNSKEQADEIVDNHFISVEYLREKFTYKKGKLLNRKTGKEVGHTLANGYKKVQLHNSIVLSIHVIIWTCKTGEFPKGVIDHIDGDHTNNRFKNLRDVSSGENSANRKGNVKEQSNCVGVNYRSEDANPWVVHLLTRGKLKLHGSFKTEKKAIKKWQKIQTELLGYPPE